VVRAEARDVDRDAGEHVLHVGLGQAAVAGVAQAGVVYGLGDGAFDADAFVVERRPFGAVLAGAG